MLKMAFGIDKKDYEDLQVFFKDFPKLIEEAVSDATTWGLQKIVARTPIDTGEARASFGMPRRVNKLTYMIKSDVGAGSKYTPFLEFGTGVYGAKRRPITPKNGKMYLVFPIVKKNTIKGWVKVKSVKGMHPRGMMSKTAPHIMRELVKNIKENVSDAIKKKGG